MRRTLPAALVAAITILASPGAAAPVEADHCFGVDVEPRSGPVGTEFVIGQSSGLAGMVTLFHEGVRVARVRVGGRDGEEYRFVSKPADVGMWRAHLRIPDGDRPCGPNAWFTVTAAPDTATVGPARPQDRDPLRTLVLVLAALAGGGLGKRRIARASGRAVACPVSMDQRRPNQPDARSANAPSWTRTRAAARSGPGSRSSARNGIRSRRR